MKRFVAMLLTLTMVLGLTSSAMAAPADSDSGIKTVTAEEVSGSNRLDEISSELKKQDETAAAYAPDDMVTVIVELDQAPVLEAFDQDAAEEKGLGVGEAVASFLAGDASKAAREALLSAQKTLLSQIAEEVKTTEENKQPQVIAQWTDVLNAMAVEVRYGDLETIAAMKGVKRAYVQHVYDRPVTVKEEAAEKPYYNYSYNMIGLGEAWEKGFTGKGMLVAILDTGLDVLQNSWTGNSTDRSHEAFSDDSFMSDLSDSDLRYTDESLRLFLTTTQLNSTTASDGSMLVWEHNALYKNRKVPYACDYADGDLNVQPADSNHGTHVAGTIAGYAETEEGEIKFSGIAPDAQILAMKVFPDDSASGAQEYAIYNALEDAMRLGADVVNLSLGSDNGYAFDDTASNELYARMEEAGIVLVTSAGNSAYSTSNNHNGGYSLTEDPETSMISAPAVYDSNMAIASIDTGLSAYSVLTWFDGEGNETTIPFTDSTGIAMKYGFAGKDPVEIIPVEGVGTYQDYYNAGFNNGWNGGKTGIALVKRGEISFLDKINNASSFSGVNSQGERYGVLAVIVYDSDPESDELIYMSSDGAALTAAFISGRNGAAIKAAVDAGQTVTMTVEEEDEVSYDSAAAQMSSFSSWGAGAGLELKPEITAPGGTIWSAIVDPYYNSLPDENGMYPDYEGSYDMMSGTSMAAPHVTGMIALLRQYAKESLHMSASAGELASQLLASTAVPVKNADGVYESPRLQGAGLANVGKAMSTPAYITVKDKLIGKLELGDDPDRNGTYALNFNVNNISDQALTYHVKAVLLRPDVGEADGKAVMLDSDVLIKEVDLGTVSVPASGSAKVNLSVSLTEEEKAELNSIFANGTYVEGFVILTDAENNNPQIGLPMLAFYGDWTDAPIFDRAMWFDDAPEDTTIWEIESTWGTSSIGSLLTDGSSVFGYYNLGQNIFDATAVTTQRKYYKENFTISPNGDGYLDVIDDFALYQLRDARAVVVQVTDANTGEVYYRDVATYQTKSVYNATYGVAIPTSQYYFTGTSWDGTDLNGTILPSGTECIMTVTAYGDGDYGDLVWNDEAGRLVTDFEAIVPGVNEPLFNGHAMNKTGDEISFQVQVDTEAPKLVNNAVSIYEEDGRTYVKGTFQDDGSIASVEIHPYVARTYKNMPEGYDNPPQYGIDRSNPFYSEVIYDPDVHTWSFVADVTEYAHTIESYPGENNTYNFEWTGILYISGGDYGANDRTYAVKVDTTPGIVLSYTSALLHPGETMELQVVDNTEEGGALTRTSSNPEVATVDEFGTVTAVAPGQTVITVSNEKGDSAVCIVGVEEIATEITDFKLSIDHFNGLKPGGSLVVKVTDIQPASAVITEKTWIVTEDDEDYAGLLNVSQYDSTGLIGEVYLNYSTSTEVHIPGGTGTLTVTLNGLSRTCTFSWEDLYDSSGEDDLISANSYGDQTKYITMGESAQLLAQYKNTSAHTVSDVILRSAGEDENAETNLILDGPDFFSPGVAWSGRLVNKEGYALPETIQPYTRYVYSDGTVYDAPISNYSWSTYWDYDPATGIINVYQTPYGATNILLIKADGIVSEGNPAGELSGINYERPEYANGPFDWEIVEGSGTLEQLEVEDYYGTMTYPVQFTPEEPGATYIRATTKDGAYSVHYVVVTRPVRAETITLDQTSIELEIGDTSVLNAALSPVPTLEEDAQIEWKSFDPEVAAVDENGVVTAVSEGYSFIKASSVVDDSIYGYCVVHVVPASGPNFTDVDEDAWYYDAVQYVCETGLFLGTSDTTFGPDEVMDRAMLATVLYRLEGEPDVTGQELIFTDVPEDTWYTDAVIWANANGIVNGTGDTTFSPGEPVVREQIATLLYRYAEWKGYDTTARADLSGYADADLISEYAADAISWANAAGLIMGNSANTLNPAGDATRAEVAAILLRFAENVQ